MRALSSMVLPFAMPFMLDKMGMKLSLLTLSTSAFLGQYIFILGIEKQSYMYCLVSRLIFGISDCQTILQQTIMC